MSMEIQSGGMVPPRTVLVRHGESQENVFTKMIKDARKAGASDRELSALWRSLRKRKHTSRVRLTQRGREQAAAAGEWLRRELPDGFGRYYVSHYVRALETAGHLAIPGADWCEEMRISERDWGKSHLLSMSRYFDMRDDMWENPMHACPPDGESLHSMATGRNKSFVDTLARRYSNVPVCCVGHGEVLWVTRFNLERMTVEQFEELDRSEDPFDRIHNCEIIQYERFNPFTGVDEGRYNWMRSVCPWDLSLSRNVWQPIVRRKRTAEDLLAYVEKFSDLDHVR